MSEKTCQHADLFVAMGSAPKPLSPHATPEERVVWFDRYYTWYHGPREIVDPTAALVEALEKAHKALAAVEGEIEDAAETDAAWEAVGKAQRTIAVALAKAQQR